MTLAEILALCKRHNLVFYSYRLPHSTDIFTGIQLSDKVISSQTIELNKKGFLIAPFHADVRQIFQIMPDIYFMNDEITDAELSAIENSHNKSEYIDNQPIAISKEDYLLQANQLIDLLKAKVVNKVVLSRTEVEQGVEHLDAPAIFYQLTQKHPHAFVSIFHLPKQGTWVGASPETLLSIDTNGVKTMSLAATKPANNTRAWSAKEFEEQQIVSDFVEKVLRKYPFESIQVSATKDQNAGHISHLVTEYQCDGKLNEHQLTDLIFDLHPTPAVCGIPKEKALDVILQNEKHNREFYAGFIGPIGHDNAQLFVNLRCMKLTSKSVTYFAGGGLTALSNAEAEWEETCLKMKTLR